MSLELQWFNLKQGNDGPLNRHTLPNLKYGR